MVGKGLTVAVLGELFFYAALTFVPMALPLATLLASLMTFGNLGEHFELTAMKASGISLLRTMKPLIITMVIVAIAAFFFSEQCAADSSDKNVDIAIFNTPHISGDRNSRRRFLRPDFRI